MTALIEGNLARHLIAGMKPYRKKSTTLMIQMDDDFVIGQPSSGEIAGHITAPAGSYLAHDPRTGAFWPISAQYVEDNYEPVEPE